MNRSTIAAAALAVTATTGAALYQLRTQPSPTTDLPTIVADCSMERGIMQKACVCHALQPYPDQARAQHCPILDHQP